MNLEPNREREEVPTEGTHSVTPLAALLKKPTTLNKDKVVINPYRKIPPPLVAEIIRGGTFTSVNYLDSCIKYMVDHPAAVDRFNPDVKAGKPVPPTPSPTGYQPLARIGNEPMSNRIPSMTEREYDMYYRMYIRGDIKNYNDYITKGGSDYVPPGDPQALCPSGRHTRSQGPICNYWPW